MWLSLSRCGDLAPGLDIVPRRIDHVLPTGTEGAVFDWSVSQAVVEEAAGDAGIVRPIFEPGDVLLFDELCVHATAAEPRDAEPALRHRELVLRPLGLPGQLRPAGRLSRRLSLNFLRPPAAA